MNELAHIFLTFAKIGVSTFGGGYSALPVMQHEMVDKQHWLSEEELTDYYALAQCQPGLIFINCATLIMRPRKGRAAAWAASFGIAAPSFIIILLIAMLLYRFMDLPVVAHAMGGVRVAVAATVIHSAWRLVKSGVKDWFTGAICAAALILLLLKANAIAIILGSALLSLAVWKLKESRTARTGGEGK
ncbi:MAG: chromate transporter [Firmicutes bacterium]|nr:chromate transporter [Bacillota bacterium]